jgi:hypothetical protein
MVVWGGYGGSSPMKSGGQYCPCTTVSKYYQDLDGDGRGSQAVSVLTCPQPVDFVLDGTDCNDSDASVWHVPSEARLLLFTDATHLSWTVPDDPGTTASIVYDVLRDTAPDFRVAGVCVANNLTLTSWDDPTLPDLDTALYYYVRPGNSCGDGILGYSSGGVSIGVGPPCP